MIKKIKGLQVHISEFPLQFKMTIQKDSEYAKKPDTREKYRENDIQTD